MNEIERFYDEYDEWSRFDRHRIEFDITKRYMDLYLPAPQRILDIGGGPGRYSLYLAGKGHRVTLLDLSGESISRAKLESEKAGIQLEGYIHGDALALPEFERPFDAVLLMGPLYHLVKEADRIRAVEQALSCLKPGGILIAAFISQYGWMQDCLTHLIMPETVDSLFQYLDNGVNSDGDGFTTAYFTSAKEARTLMARPELQKLAFVGVENILACKEPELMALPEEEYQKWLEVGFRMSRNEEVIGTSEHFLYIGRKRGDKPCDE